jgi:hypothetical protein
LGQGSVSLLRLLDEEKALRFEGLLEKVSRVVVMEDVDGLAYGS